MPEKQYQKRELDHYFNDLFKRMDKQDAQLSSIDSRIGIQNGRVTKLETWSLEAQKVIQDNLDILQNYKVDRGRILTAIAIAILLGATIVTLSLMAIDSKIQKASHDAAKEAAVDLWSDYKRIIIDNE